MITLPIFGTHKKAHPNGHPAKVAHEINLQGRTVHPHAPHPKPNARKIVTLDQLADGQCARIVRVAMADPLCRRRFAELGLAEGMKVTVAGVGETLLLIVGTGRMGIGQHCAQQVHVMPL